MTSSHKFEPWKEFTISQNPQGLVSIWKKFLSTHRFYRTVRKLFICLHYFQTIFSRVLVSHSVISGASWGGKGWEGARTALGMPSLQHNHHHFSSVFCKVSLEKLILLPKTEIFWSTILSSIKLILNPLQPYTMCSFLSDIRKRHFFWSQWCLLLGGKFSNISSSVPFHAAVKGHAYSWHNPDAFEDDYLATPQSSLLQAKINPLCFNPFIQISLPNI